VVGGLTVGAKAESNGIPFGAALVGIIIGTVVPAEGRGEYAPGDGADGPLMAIGKPGLPGPQLVHNGMSEEIGAPYPGLP
jgi:hypothetical protein